MKEMIREIREIRKDFKVFSFIREVLNEVLAFVFELRKIGFAFELMIISLTGAAFMNMLLVVVALVYYFGEIFRGLV